MVNGVAQSLGSPVGVEGTPDGGRVGTYASALRILGHAVSALGLGPCRGWSPGWCKSTGIWLGKGTMPHCECGYVTLRCGKVCFPLCMTRNLIRLRGWSCSCVAVDGATAG
jgi:hypothetical protein